jgi:two-component system nitrate/nitrite response regulator NarP
MDPELTLRVQELERTFGETRRPALAPRERQLIRFVRQGLRNREIAKELGVTEGTVKVYLHGIFDKLGVNSRTELAIRADEFLTESYLRN